MYLAGINLGHLIIIKGLKLKHPTLCIIAACLACALAPVSAMAAPKSAPPAVVLTAEAVNEAGKTLSADGKTDSAAVLRAQILLDRAHFSSGEIDGAAGSNLKMAIAGFQRKNGIKDSGVLDTATWSALNADPAAALAVYTVAEADIAGPFTPIPEDMADKAKLPALGYASALEGLGEKFHASTKLLQKLNPGKDLAKVGEQILVPNVLDTEPLPKAGKIVVDRSDRTLQLFDAGGKLIAQFPASSGTDKDPLPIGSWKVNGVSKNPKFHYNPKLFWDAEPGDKKATIPPGPNNPVGVAWIDLSKPHYGIHGTPVPSAIGKTQSHGCIRLTNWDVMTVTESVGPGTAVVMQE
jgi:lipoprotein-anchoring transpeptidase ErfK/SrfK